MLHLHSSPTPNNRSNLQRRYVTRFKKLSTSEENMSGLTYRVEYYFATNREIVLASYAVQQVKSTVLRKMEFLTE
jgi:hypothetical protein